MSDTSLAAPAEGGRREPTDAERAQRQAVALLRAFALLYAGGIAFLAYGDNFGFLWKTMVVPSLLVVAALSGRFRPFVREWGPFLGALMLFDALRGLIFALVTGCDLPLYAGYVIDAERALLGGETLPVLLQQAFLGPRPGAFEKFLVVIHGSHFLVFLLFGFLIWIVRPAAFAHFRRGLLLLIGGGLLGYLLVPTIPPWMAHDVFALLPPVRRVTSEIYNLEMPSLRASFDVNPIAAMPSLHTAFPAYLSLVALRHFGRRGWWMVGYFALVVTCITYLGEHYALDVVAGMALAGAAYFLSHRARPQARVGASDASLVRAPRLALGVPLLLTAFLLVATEGVRIATERWRRPFVANAAFIERELTGRSPMASFYAGKLALEQGDAWRAEALFARAMTETPEGPLRGMAVLGFARAAFQNGRVAESLQAIEKLPARLLAPTALGLKAQVLARLGRGSEASAVLDELRQRSPGDPESAYELALASHALGRVSKSTLEAVAERLAALRGENQLWAVRASELRSLAARAAH